MNMKHSHTSFKDSTNIYQKRHHKLTIQQPSRLKSQKLLFRFVLGLASLGLMATSVTHAEVAYQGAGYHESGYQESGYQAMTYEEPEFANPHYGDEPYGNANSVNNANNYAKNDRYRAEPFIPMPSVLELDSGSATKAYQQTYQRDDSRQPQPYEATHAYQTAQYSSQPAISANHLSPVSNRHIAMLLVEQDLGVWNPYKNTIVAGYMEFRANLQNAMNNDINLRMNLQPMSEEDFETWYISQYQTLAMAFADNNALAARKIINGIQVNSPNTLASILQQVQRDYDIAKQNYEQLTAEGYQLKQDVLALDRRITAYQQKIQTSQQAVTLNQKQQQLQKMNNFFEMFKFTK